MARGSVELRALGRMARRRVDGEPLVAGTRRARRRPEPLVRRAPYVAVCSLRLAAVPRGHLRARMRPPPIPDDLGFSTLVAPLPALSLDICGTLAAPGILAEED